MRYPSRLIALIATPLLLASGIAGASAAGRTAAAAAPLVKTVDGLILTGGSKNLALYVYTPDKPNVSNCYGPCAKFWPPAIVPKGTTVPKTITGIAGTFGVTMRKDGSQQLTYDTAPLYNFLKDKDSGDLYGEGVEGIWWAVVVKSPNT